MSIYLNDGGNKLIRYLAGAFWNETSYENKYFQKGWIKNPSGAGNVVVYELVGAPGSSYPEISFIGGVNWNATFNRLEQAVQVTPTTGSTLSFETTDFTTGNPITNELIGAATIGVYTAPAQTARIKARARYTEGPGPWSPYIETSGTDPREPE